MDVRRRKMFRAAAFAAFLVLVAFLAWMFLSLFHSPYADWLSVEAPRDVAAGEKTSARVTLGEVPEPSVLVVGLYFLARDHEPIGSRHASGPSPGIRSGGTYTFEFEVTPQEKLALVQFVLYLSPNGNWRDRTRGANSEVIPVKAPKKPGAVSAWRKVRAYAIARTSHPEAPFRPGGHPPPPDLIPAVPTPSGAVLFALLVSGGLIFRLEARRLRTIARFEEGRRAAGGTGGGEAAPAAGKSEARNGHARIVSGRRGTGPTGRDRRLWLAVSGVLFVLAVSEFLLLEVRISSWGRRIAEELDLYYLRQPVQKAVIAAMIAGAAGILVLAARSLMEGRGRSRPKLAGVLVALYLGLAVSGSLSFHYMDDLKSIRLSGVSLVDAAKILLAAALLAVGLSALAKRRVRGSSVAREGDLL
jgi:hypothetical protein